MLMKKFQKYYQKIYLSKDELADLSVDELVEIIKIDEELAAKIIMNARSDWFEE